MRAKKRKQAVTKERRLVARVESRHHHHVERWGTRDKPREQGTRATRAVYGETNKTKTRTTLLSIYGRDPEGPLAPEEGQRPYSIHPPPNGNVRVPTPETTCETFYENPF